MPLLPDRPNIYKGSQLIYTSEETRYQATIEGGTETTESGEQLCTFTVNGTLTVASAGYARVLCVGPGGPGASGAGGGGGQVIDTEIWLEVGTYSVRVGESGANSNETWGTSISLNGAGVLTSVPGGRGASTNGSTWCATHSGGGQRRSGTGSGAADSAGPGGYAGGAGFAGTGGTDYAGGGGGGGAGGGGQAGQSINLGGNGGNGIASDITGSTVYYGGGGGGASADTYGPSSGGSGGGGAGGTTGSGTAVAGTANTGGGGGGRASSSSGAVGGSGIVIVRAAAVEE